MLFAGLLSGVIMGSIGIGGGAFLVPLLLLSGLTLQQATVVVLITQVIPQTLPALAIYYKKNVFPWKEGIIVSVGSLIGATLGAYITTHGFVKTKNLYRSFVMLLILLAAMVWWKYW